MINSSLKSFSILCKSPKILLTQRTMYLSVKQGAVSMQLARESYIKFCLHFEKIPYNLLAFDSFVINFFDSVLTKESYLCNKAFQLALDVTYSKRKFNRKDVLTNFDKYVSFNNPLDPYDTTSNMDQSTLYTALQSKILKSHNNTWDITVNETPTNNVPTSNLFPTMQTILEENKTLTGNRYPDISINGIPYDYKYSNDLYNTKNQIYIMPESAEASKLFQRHIHNLFAYIDSKNGSNLPKSFVHLLKSKLSIIKSELQKPQLSPTETRELNQTWNKLILEIGEYRPKGFGTSLFIILDKPYIPDSSLAPQIDQLSIPEGILDQFKTKQALNAIIGNYPDRLQDTIYKATLGTLGHHISTKLEDIP